MRPSGNPTSPGDLRAQIHGGSRAVFELYRFGFEKRCSLLWQFVKFPVRVGFQGLYSQNREAKVFVKAVATLGHEHLAQANVAYDYYQIVDLDDDFSATSVPYRIIGEDSTEVDLDQKERLRRFRISNANKGSTPWNKGRKHSAETIQLIKERTKIAMQSPKVKAKLKNLGHVQSDETKVKIGGSVQLAWRRRRRRLRVQESCLYEWQNLIAETSQSGLVGEGEFQWDSYKILDEQLEQQWLESIEQRKSLPRPKGTRRTPKSREQRRKIAEAITAKWEDPEYRERVCNGMAKHYGAPVGTSRKLRRNSYNKQSGRTRLSKNDSNEDEIASTTVINSKVQKLKVAKRNKPQYNDPMAGSKLEMIKNIRAQRAAAEKKAVEAVECARLLIAQAENAADSLELAAITSPKAHLSLIEARKLVAEAIQFLESCDNQDVSSASDNTGMDPCFRINKRDQMPLVAMDKDFDFGNFTLHNALKGGNAFLSACMKPAVLESTSSDGKLGRIKYDNPVTMNSSTEHESNSPAMESRNAESSTWKGVIARTLAMKKKWVRGKFVEVKEID